MKSLFILLLFCSAVSGQVIFHGRDSSIIKIIDDLPSSEPFDTANAYRKVNRPYVYIISDHDLYNVFGFELSEKYRGFNFADYHILGTMQCKQCLEYCQHDEGNINCHRNSCTPEWVWVMRDNKKAFARIPVTVIPEHIGTEFPSNLHLLFGDTLIKAATDTSMTNWYTTGHGDCLAHFNYELVTDKYHPVLLLKEWNYWGGCRAAGIKHYTISFKMPADHLYHTKNIAFAERSGY